MQSEWKGVLYHRKGEGMNSDFDLRKSKIWVPDSRFLKILLPESSVEWVVVDLEMIWDPREEKG